MKAMARGLMAAVPMAAFLLAPAIANAHPTKDEVIVDAFDSTVEVMIVNTHDHAINCETNIDGGPTLFMTVDADDANWTTHEGIGAGTHTVNWGCPTDVNGPSNHGGGTLTVTGGGSNSGSDFGDWF